ncbi:hypothetical protein [Pseudomonas sp. GXZC]|uniref:hypothetical protein n=1 Tax=Pseudomonas sp. GXZC TaxID=3003351 RepID=UPI0022AB124C|nr:hypothetical protein [Pseudomonas sp. GXZC]WAT32292.1 hypothetical protein OZ428_34325 [Pseudomonas sp. GXZC]
MTEEEMRQALFGSVGAAEQSTVPKTQPHAVAATKRKMAKPFAPKLEVTLRVGNQFEGETELLTHEADTLSTLQAELDATKLARKKYKFIEVISVKRL